jgi:uncharacterized membrane protein (DUF106 family)
VAHTVLYLCVYCTVRERRVEKMNNKQRTIMMEQQTRLKRELKGHLIGIVGLVIFLLVFIWTVLIPVVCIIAIAMKSSRMTKIKDELTRIEFELAK